MEFGCWERWPAGGMHTGILRYAMKVAIAKGLDDAGGPTTGAKCSREREFHLCRPRSLAAPALPSLFERLFVY
jgi:hypothetical protein